MLKRINITETLIKNVIRYFKISLYGRNNSYYEQYHSGGDDYNPVPGTKILGGFINDRPGDGVVWLYQDGTERKSAPGEKRIYSVNPEKGSVVTEIHLKNDGNVSIIANGAIEFTATGDVNISGQTLNAFFSKCNFGSGGQPVARLGDEVTMADGTKGTITSAGVNTSV